MTSIAYHNALGNKEMLIEKQPLISIAVISYNQMKTLPRCIQSIGAQTYQNIELIIVDDHSCDWDYSEIKEEIDRIPYKCHCTVHRMQSHCGPQTAHQWALETAHGEFILYLGGDDWLSNADAIMGVVGQIGHFNNLPDTIQARTQLEGSNQLVLPDPKLGYVFRGNAASIVCSIATNTQKTIAFHSALFRVNYLIQEGGFQEAYQYMLDAPLFCHLIISGAVLVLTDCILTKEKDGGMYRSESLYATYFYEGVANDNKRLVEEEIIPYLNEKRKTKEALICQKYLERMKIDAEMKRWWFTLTHAERKAWKKEHKGSISNLPKGPFSFSMKQLLVLMITSTVLFLSITRIYPDGVVLSQDLSVKGLISMLLVCIGSVGCSRIRRQQPLFILLLCLASIMAIVCALGCIKAPVTIPCWTIAMLVVMFVALFVFETIRRVVVDKKLIIGR